MTGDRHLPGFVVLAALYRIANGPQAPRRKRRRRLAKKIKRRGGWLRTRGLTQSYLQARPEMRKWWT